MAKKIKEEKPIVENIISDTLDELMGQKYAVYAKDVIQDRAIPDARDGLKPVQRRIIYSMIRTGNTADKPTKKCARIAGDVMGRYHPHGDASIYDALARMSQSWVCRYPLVIFQGNNGSIDGDGPAAARYTEAKLSWLANEMVVDIDHDAVNMTFNYDDTELEPTILPARFPNLLVNGAEGIAVGTATHIPPHNLVEVTDCIIHRIKHPSCTDEDLFSIIHGPDFPTGGIIYDSPDLKNIYLKGKGKAVVASRTTIENDGDKPQIIVSEIPFGVNKSQLVKQIDIIRHDKKIPGIEEVRDESDKSGLRIAIDLKKDVKPDAVLAYLMKNTQLKVSYSAQIIAIKDGHPRILTISDYCDCYINHQLDVISRRSRYILKKDEDRLNIVEGLVKLVSSLLDPIIALIRSSKDKADCKTNIMEAYGFNEAQAEAIVTMPLFKLSHTDVEVLLAEKKALEEEIADLNETLSSQSKRENIIISDLKAISKKYGDARKSEIIGQEHMNEEYDKRDLIAKEEVIVVASRDGYIKRSSLKSYKASVVAGVEKAGLKEGDNFIFQAHCFTTDYALLFTKSGQYAIVAINEIKDNKWTQEGFHISSLVSTKPEDKFVYGLVISAWREDIYIIMLSRLGFVKRVKLSSLFAQRRKKMLGGISLGKGDELVSVAIASGDSDLLIASSEGQAILYNENDILISNPKSRGMKAASFKGKPIAGMLSFSKEEKKGKILLLTDKGHIRIFDMGKIEKTHRLDKPMTLYSFFKKEPHSLVYMAKIIDQDNPMDIDVLLSDGKELTITVDDFHLTPMDKYAKRPEGFPAKPKIKDIAVSSSPIVDEKTPSYPLPVTAKKEEEEEVVDDLLKQEESFEQISLFDDLND